MGCLYFLSWTNHPEARRSKSENSRLQTLDTVMVYRPISEYGVIGNDDRIALVDSDGSIDWCCFPHVAAPSVFARLLDAEGGGHFAVRPTATYESTQEYLDTTNVLRTTFETSTGRATLTDFMPVVAADRPNRYQHAIFRHLRCDEECLNIEVDFNPRFDYARATATVREADRHIVATPKDSEGTGQTNATPASADHLQIDHDESLSLQATGPLELSPKRDRAVGTSVLREGQSVWFALQYNHFRPMPPTKCHRVQSETVEYWTAWGKKVEETVTSLVGAEEWHEEIVRSGLVLKLLINERTGAIYAAATTSLPEEYGGERNWDYRYNWMRDAKFTVQALYNLGQKDEAKQYFDWFREISHDDPDDIQPVYGVHGERELTEHVLDHLAGYRYSTPVRIGNGAAEQRQLDTYGTIIQGLYETLLHDEQIDRDDWNSIRALVDHVCSVWDEKGEGIWEFREEPRHYVHSKLLCWVALDRGIELAENHDEDVDTTHWEEQREAVREAIETRGYSESAGSFVQHFETEDTFDAACLLIPVYEFLPADDQRVQNTIDTVIEELMTDDGLVHRTAGSDAPEEGRGTFLFCTFWLVDALVLAGRLDEAKEIFTNVMDYVTSPALLPERLDPETGEYLGNYPQAFSHIGLVNSAVYLCSELADEELAHDPQQESDVKPLFRS